MFMWLVISLFTAGLVSWLVRRVSRVGRKDGNSVSKTSIPQNTVCLFQVGRGPLTPSLSPFPLKLETFLRMAKIPYMNDHSGQFSKKGKTPWMLYNGQRVEDSQICVEFLKCQSIGVDVNKGLTDEELSTARAFRELTEENLYWTMCYESFVHTPTSLDILLKDIFPWWKTLLFKKGVGYKVKQQLWGQGIGRHSEAEIWDIATRDLRALSCYLGSKPFLLGDEPHEIDCTVFGMLSMIVWQMRTTRHEEFVTSELPNLVEYCERMRDRFWPDWQQRRKGDNYEKDDGKIYS